VFGLLSRPTRRFALVGVMVALTTNGVLAAPSRAATVESDRAQIEKLQKEIAQKGAEVESLVHDASTASTHLDALHDKIRRDERLLASDAQAERAARNLVQHAAVVAYLAGGGSNASLAMFDDTSSITQVMTGQHYLNAVNAHWDDAITQLELAKARADDDRRELLKQQDDAQRAFDQVTHAQVAARTAITAENATLTRVQSNLTALLVTQQKQKAAEARQAAARAIAAVLAGATQKEDAAPSDAPRGPAEQPSPPTIVMPPPKPVTGGGYANPLRSVGSLTPERIDSGVDYAGSGPVYAIGNGVVVNVYAGDWPGGVFVAYQLSDGPAKGLFVYTAEDLNPQVSVGSTVTANTVIGEMYGGPHGIEIGWADGSRIPNAMARSYGQYHGGNSTAFGYNFSRFLQALGAPGGVLQNNPTGTLPAGWPAW
jgi:murein DD-endopeptidase MepM/ murein hydrolase activator NlpD